MNAAEQNSSGPTGPVDTADTGETAETSDRIDRVNCVATAGRDRVLRLWPAFVIVGVQWVIMLGPQLAAQFAIEPTTATPQTVESTLLDNPQTVLNSKHSKRFLHQKLWRQINSQHEFAQ